MPRRPRTVAEQATIDTRAEHSPGVLSRDGQKDRKRSRRRNWHRGNRRRASA